MCLPTGFLGGLLLHFPTVFLPPKIEPMRICSRCHESLPLAAFPVDRSRAHGRGYVCSPCRSRKTTPGPALQERRAQETRGLKWCRGCLAWLPAPAVRKGACQGCINRETRQRYEIDQRFRRRRIDRAVARRRNVAAMPLEAQEAILADFAGRCAYCPAPATTWDHVLSVRRGGMTEPHNTVPACRPCNSSKRDADVWKWLARTGRTMRPEAVERLSLFHLTETHGPSALDSLALH